MLYFIVMALEDGGEGREAVVWHIPEEEAR